VTRQQLLQLVHKQQDYIPSRRSRAKPNKEADNVTDTDLQPLLPTLANAFIYLLRREFRIPILEKYNNRTRVVMHPDGKCSCHPDV